MLTYDTAKEVFTSRLSWYQANHPSIAEALAPLYEFLASPTPKSWVDQALLDTKTLLIDHAYCEKKAAATALSLLFKYPSHIDVLKPLTQLAREELLHFEQVHDLMQQKDIEYRAIKPSRYAGSLRRHVSEDSTQKLIDTLIIGAIIEARSAERFSALVPVLTDTDIQKFYRFLLKSEARHFEMYLDFAKSISSDSEAVLSRSKYFLEIESDLIQSEDAQFRFHSGVPNLAA